MCKIKKKKIFKGDIAMFSREDILAQLRNGADASDIAQKMADAINGALSDFEAEKEKAKKAKEAEAKREKEMRADANKVIDVMTDFYNKYFGEITFDKEEKEELINTMIDMAKEAIKEIEHIQKMTKNLKDVMSAPSAEKEIDDDTLRRFLASL